MSRIQNFIHRMSQNRTLSVLGVLAIVALIIAGAFAFFGTKEEVGVSAEEPLSSVEVASVAMLGEQLEPTVVIGTVRSQSEATLRVESSGEVVRVTVQAGDRVSAGTILAEFENGTQRAQILQAQGQLEAAQASLASVRAGDRPAQQAITQANLGSAEQNLTSARAAALDAIRQSYFLAEDAVHNKADVIFTNPQAQNAELKFNLPTIKYGDLELRIEGDRPKVEKILETWGASLPSLSAQDNLEQELSKARENLTVIRTLLDNEGEGVNSTSFEDGDIATWRASVAAARAAVASAFSTITGAEQNLEARKLALETAKRQQDISTEGGRPEDVRGSSAQVTQARAAVALAQAAWEKTVIRTPISGTVSTLSVKRGDFVSLGALAAVVTNENALEIEAFVTADLKERLVEGASATINGNIEAVVTNIEPGLDPDTKKSRVTFGVIDPNANLTHGSTVNVSVQPTNNTPSDESGSNAQNGFAIPITAFKVLPNALVVFTVSENNTLVAHEVVEGPIVGDRMLIREGLTADMLIVRDARGLSEGEQVTLQ